MFTGFADLIDRLDAAVGAGDADAVTVAVKRDLETLLSGNWQLPERFLAPRPDCYARRLLHQDPANRYSAVVMTWGPGQGTAVHDHGGLWCVEGVVAGEMQVTQYDVAHDPAGAYRLAPCGAPMRAGVGTAGRLIPPTDYHVLENALPDRPSITLHVYGGSLDNCRVFQPRPDGRFDETFRSLTYHA